MPTEQNIKTDAASQQATIVHALLSIKSRDTKYPAVLHKKNKEWAHESWLDYYNYVDQVAHGLSQLQLAKGDRVAIISNTRFEWILIDMAILSLGGITVPIYPSNTTEDIEYVLNNSEAKFLFCEDNLQLEKWSAIKSNCPHVQNIFSINDLDSTETLSLKKLASQGKESIKTNPDLLTEQISQVKIHDTATILYTSGTTGQPKGVVITHEQIMSEVADVFDQLGIGTGDRSLTFLPSSHILGRVELWGHLYAGFTCAYAESIEKIKPNLGEVSPTFLLAVPRIFEKIYNGILSQSETSPIKNKIFQWALSIGRQVSALQLSKEPIPLTLLPQYKLAQKLVFSKLHKALGGRLKWAISGSAPLSQEISEFFHAAGIIILEGYGLTETTAGAFFNFPHDFQFGNVGKPIGDVQVKIAEDGEILIKSKKVMKEYYKNPEATAETIKDGWLYTGDIGELDSELRLKITDRKKDLIKTAGGKYVAPQKLEGLLKLNKFISNVLIHGDQKKYIIALITLDPDTITKYAKENGLSYTNLENLSSNQKIKEQIHEAIAQTNASLASYESIKTFAILPKDFSIEEGELTPSLKVKRKVCDQKYKDIIDGLYGVDRSAL